MRRPRITTRQLILLIALVAAGLFVYREFDHGSPPRLVIRGIPARINQLKPGMHSAEVGSILGLHQSWLRGGVGESEGVGRGGAGHTFISYRIGQRQRLCQVQVLYKDATDGWRPTAEGEDPLTLVWARFLIEGVTIAESPKGRR